MTEQDRNDTAPEETDLDGVTVEDAGNGESGGDREAEDFRASPETGTGPEAEESEPDSVAAPGDEMAELRRELDAANDRHLRLAAEFDNYRKRHQRDREALSSRLRAELVTALLDVLDDLQRVEEGEDGVDVAGVLEGVRLVEKKLLTVLEAAGLTAVDAEGARFDPELMEALGMVRTDNPEEDGHVADVFQRGYRLHELLLRPARVRVYQYDETE